MARLGVKLLGPISCELPNGRPLSLSTRKSEALLAYLAMSAGVSQPRERLLNLFWSDRGEEQARNSLRQALSSLRKALEAELPDALQIDRTRVCLNAEAVIVDVDAFKLLSQDSAIDKLAEAVDMCHGEFLEGLIIRDPAGEQWLQEQRENLGRIFLDVLGRLSRLELEAGDYKSATAHAEQIISVDPLDESGWRLLMLSQHRNGNRNHALMAYKRCSELLQKELGVEPEVETQDLWQQIKIGKPADVGSNGINMQEKAGYARYPVEPAQTQGYKIAVLPFDNLSGNPEQEYFSDGITDSIILNLSLFPGLHVKSRNSSFAFKQQIKGLGEISKELNVDYLVEGSVRKSNNRIRVTVQLIDARSGDQVWGKRYDSELSDLFELEEELSRSIAATVTGQIESAVQCVAIKKPASDQDSYDLLLSGTYYAYRFTQQDNVIAIDYLNQCLQKEPDNLRANVMLCICHGMAYLDRWTSDYQASFRLSEKHILKALEIDAENSMVQTFYAEYLGFSGRLDEAVDHLNKALEINPNNPDAMTILAFIQNARGEFEAALQLSKLAMQLDPYHPWAEWELANAQFVLGQYQDTLNTIKNFRTSPGFTQIYTVAANIKLGRIDSARKALQAFLNQCREDMLSMPQTLGQWFEYTRCNYPFADSHINENLVDCLVQAGLKEDLAKYLPDESGATETPSILVLPFENLSVDRDQDYFSDAITESIVLSLSTSKDLQVKSRHTSFAYRDCASDINAIGESLGVEYIVEGSIRKYGDQLRVTVQLADVISGNQIWGERYNGSVADLFEFEEELVNTIVGTISGRIGREIRTSSIEKSSRDLKSFDYLARGNYYLERLSVDNLAEAKKLFRKCLEIDITNADAHTGLAIATFIELFENWAQDREAAKELAFQHIKKALTLEPENALTHAYMAEYQLFTRDFYLGLFHADRSIELGPHIPEGYSIKAYLLAITGDPHQASKLANLSLQIDPYHYYNGWNAGEALRISGEYQQALDTFHSISHPAPSLHAEIAACQMGLGQSDRARAEMEIYLELVREQMVSYPGSVDDWRRYWQENVPYQNNDEFSLFFDQLLQAGLCDTQVDT